MAQDENDQKAQQQQPKASSSSESSSSEVNNEQQQQNSRAAETEETALPPTAPVKPKDPPKIPPPPTEHPPPYTPFGGQSASLIRSGAAGAGTPATGGQARANRNPQRVIRAPGLRKYLHYLTPRNVAIGLILLGALCVLSLLIHWANKADEELAWGRGPLEGTHRALRAEHKGLGRVNGKRDRISFDEVANSVVLSEYDLDTKVLRSEYVKLDDHLSGLAPHLPFNATGHWEDDFDDCMRFTAKLVCCSTPSQGKHHMTKCFLRDDGRQYIAVASLFDFLPKWQHLADDEMLLVVHNRQQQAVLDLKKDILFPIGENRLPHGYISQGFHFSTDTADGLAELVRVGEELRICEYVRTRQGDLQHGAYVLKEPRCRSTPFRLDLELRQVLFCVNSLYTAVLQYGHLPGEQGTLHWRLRLQFESSALVYSAHDELTQTSHGDQMAMDCDGARVNLFALNDHELHQFVVVLPEEINEHFGGAPQ